MRVVPHDRYTATLPEMKVECLLLQSCSCSYLCVKSSIWGYERDVTCRMGEFEN
jgi:hypothetical protein